MITRKGEHKVETVIGVQGGEGSAQFFRLIENPEELYNKGRVFSITTLPKGSEIGWHLHTGDGEFYHMLSGVAEYSDNGKTVTLGAGDTAFCPDGEGHSIRNNNDEPVVFLALVIYN